LTGPNLQALATGQLLVVERRAAGHEQVDFQLAVLMNQVGVAAALDGAIERFLRDVEIREGGDERRDLGAVSATTKSMSIVDRGSPANDAAIETAESGGRKPRA
jgi:hypothetical protein